MSSRRLLGSVAMSRPPTAATAAAPPTATATPSAVCERASVAANAGPARDAAANAGAARDTDLAVFAAFAASRLATALGATVARTEEQDTADILERDEGGS